MRWRSHTLAGDVKYQPAHYCGVHDQRIQISHLSLDKLTVSTNGHFFRAVHGYDDDRNDSDTDNRHTKYAHGFTESD